MNECRGRGSLAAGQKLFSDFAVEVCGYSYGVNLGPLNKWCSWLAGGTPVSRELFASGFTSN